MSSSTTRRSVVAIAATVIAATVGVPAVLGQSSPRPSKLPPRPGNATQAQYVMTGEGVQATFHDLLSMTSEVETVEYMEAGERGPVFGRTVGKRKPPQVTLRRPMTYGLGLAEWQQLVSAETRGAFKTVMLELHSEGRVVARWRLTNAWPSKLEVAPVRDVLTETVTFAADELTRDSPN